MSDIKLTMKEGKGAGAGSTSNVTSNKKSSTEKQSAIIYDMLSEGPVEGLVDGAASVYLDSTPVMEGSSNKSFGPTNSTDVTYTASSGVITDNNGSLFSGKSTSEGSQYIRIHKAGKSGTMSIVAGTTLLTCSTNIFNTLDAFNKAGRTSVHIPGAGVGGSDLVASIGTFIDQKRVYLMSPAATTVSNVTVHVDLIALIGSIQSASQATLATAQGINASNVSAFVTTPSQTTSSIPKYNFENTAIAFRPGTRDQSYLKPPVGLGSSAIVYNASTEIAQTDLSSLSGIGSTPNSASGWDNTPEPTAARDANRVSAQTMGVTNPGEVDQISMTINFPSGIFSHKAKSGKEHSTNAEFLIDFEYTTDGTNYTSERIFGVSDASLSARGNKLNKPNTNNNGTGTVRRLTRTPFNYSFSFDVEKFQPFTDYRVNIQKVTPSQAEHGDFVHTAPSQLQAIQNIIEDKLSYPYTAYGAVILDAQNFNSIPTRGYDLRGLKIKVPTNYQPRNELYSDSPATYNRNVTTGATESSDQDWDGNFRGDLNTFTSGANTQLVWTDNPAWILLDIMTNDRYGLGKYIDPNDDFAQIDKFQLYQIAKYCDELVPDGKGGFEPRFTCNMYITELAEAQRYLSDIISIFRGMLVYFNGKVSPQLNSKKSSVYTFSKANVIGGSFSYQSTSNRFRSNQIRVTYNSADSFYRQEVEVVEDTENILETNRINPTEVVALGCTSQGQAIRHGKWMLLTERFAQEVVSFATGLNAAHLKPGDLIDIQDSDIYTTQSSGRVDSSSSSSSTVVRLDRAIDLSASGTNFDLNLIYPTGGAYLNQDTATISSTDYKRGDLLTSITSETAAINTEDDSGNNVQILWSQYSRIESKPVSSYTTDTVTVSSAFSSAPNAEVMWSITATTQATGDHVASAPKPFLITSIAEDTEQKSYTISAAGHSEDLYDLVERGYIIEETPEIRKPPTREGIIPEPTSMGLSAIPAGQESTAESIDINSTGIDLLIGWTPPLSTETNSNKKYEFIAGYEVMILGLEDAEGKGVKKTITLGPDSTGHRVKDIAPGILYTVFLRVLTTNGFYSKYIKNEIEVVASKLSLYPGPKIEQIMKGGVLNRALTISSSTVSVSQYNYQFDAPDGITYLNSTNSASCYQQNFNGMGASALAYLLFDASESSDKFKAVQFVENNTAVSANGDNLAIKYWKEVGASNEGLTTISGTASMAINTNLITGSGTSFTTEFEVGDKVFLSSGTSLFMGTINALTSDTSMRVNTNTTRAYSGVAVKKQSFIPANDVILAKIVTDASTNYSISETYAVTAGLDGAAGGGVDARSVKLAASNFVIRYDNGSPPDDSTTIDISATPQGHAATPTFDYYKSTDQGQNWSQITTDASSNTIAATATTFTLADSDEPALDSETQIRCRMFEGGVQKATDVITLFSVQDGAGGIGGVTGNLTNPTHAIATNSDGTTSASGFYNNAGGSFETFVGATSVSSNSNVLFYVGTSGTSTTATQNGLTFTLTQSTGAYALTGSSWSTDDETFTVRALIPASVHGGTGTKTLTRKYTLSKSKAGVTPPTPDDGLRTIQGYLYQEKTSAGAPSAPSGNTYTFSSGVVTGTSISTATNQPNNVWLNSPNTQEATSSNTHYTVRYYGTESSASSSTISVVYSNVVQLTSFTGVVTFSGGTLQDDQSNSVTPIEAGDVAAHIGGANTTTIDGSKITTGTISSNNLSGTSDGSTFTTAGTRITLSNGAIASKNFRIASDGSSEFKGTLKIGSNTLTETNTLNSNTVGSDLGTGYGDSSIGGLTLAANKIHTGTGTFNNSNTGFYIDNSGNFSLKDKLSFNGTTLTINGGGTFSGALSAATGTFAGGLSAATGTFAGSLSAATGTFAGNISGASGTFTGSITGATGTFTGSITGSTGTFGDATLNSNGLTISGTGSSINLGSGKFVATGAGAVTAKELTLTGSVSGGLNSGTGTSRVQIATDGNTIFKAGGDADAPIEVVKTGSDSIVKLNNVEIYNSSGSQVFSSADGFSDEFFSGIAQTTGTAVSTISKTVTNSSATTDAQVVTLDATQTLTISVSKPGEMSGYSYGTNATLTQAINKIPAKVQLRLMVSTNSDLSSATEIASLGTSFANGVTRTTGSGSSSQYAVTTSSETEPGFRFHEAHVFQANNTNLLSGGKFVISDTDSYTAGTYYFFAEIGGTAGTQNSGINSVSNTAASRTISVTAATGESFYVDESGDASEASGGDITAVVAGSGMTGGASSGSATLNVIGGDGITAGANEIEVSVDNTTIELSSTSGSGVVRAKTAAIANSGTALATADQIHTFVTGQGYVTSSGNTIIGTDSDINTSGSTIIDNIFVTDGVITSMGTRVLTLADLGYTGATNANNYVLPTNLAGDDINIDTGALTGATVISDLDFNITTNTSGLVTDANASVATRTLTLANLGYTGATNADVTPSWVPSSNPNYITSSITGTGVAGAPTFDIINTSSSTFNHSIEAMAPNLTANETNILVVGKASSTKNSGYIGYYYTGAGSNSNFVSIGHWGADHLLRVYGDGTVRATTGRFSSYGGGYDVSGLTVIDGSRNITAARIAANGGGDQHEFTSSSDAPLLTKSTDATTGLGFIDNSATNYLFYRGSLNHFYFNSGTVGVGVASVGSGHALNVAGGIGISSTTVIDSSRNITHIQAIASAGSHTQTSTTPHHYTANGQTGTYNKTVTYINQNNTSGSTANGMFIEMGRITNSSSAEVRHFVVGARGGQINFKIDGSGNTTATGNVSAYSDERLKTNIETLDSKKALQMRGVSFTKDGIEGSGVIAQEIEKIAPELVLTADDEMGTKSVAYGNLVGYLIETVKELKSEIDELKERLDNDISK